MKMPSVKPSFFPKINDYHRFSLLNDAKIFDWDSFLMNIPSVMPLFLELDCWLLTLFKNKCYAKILAWDSCLMRIVCCLRCFLA